MIYGNVVGGAGLDRTFIIEDADGNEFVGVLVDKETVFDATANDIRAGKVAATNTGVVTGEKEIPSCNTTEGVAIIPNGSAFKIFNMDYDFTKLQGIICAFNTSLANSTAAEKIAVNNNVYEVLSPEAISALSKDDANKAVNFGINNESGALRVIRFFMYREEY